MSNVFSWVISQFENCNSSVLKLVIIDFSIQWTGFIVAYIFQTEKFYDLFGSASFILLAFLNYKWHNGGHPRQEAQTYCIYIWALRLGLYLFMRIMKTGKDRRFNEIKHSALYFFGAWTMQGIWVFLTLLPSLLAVQSPWQRPLGTRDYAGWGIWLLGFTIEIIADYQKSSFRNDPANKEKFIHTGLWSLSRHPNYFGEILLWFGLYISASSVFRSFHYFTVLCPIFNYVLITQISGVPPLEKYGLLKWGSLPQYQDYFKRTPVLVPFWH